MRPNRRKLTFGMGGAALMLPFGTVFHTAKAQTPPSFRPYSPDTLSLLQRHIRRLGSAPALPSDGYIARMLSSWLLNGVRLGQRMHSLSIQTNEIYQFSALRPNVQAYVVRIFAPEALHRIVDEGTRKERGFNRWWKEYGAKTTLVIGSFHWMRHVVPTREGKVQVREIYWLTVWEQRKNAIIPIIRVGDEYVGFTTLKAAPSDSGLRTKIRNVPHGFVDPSIALFNWHEVATLFNLRASLPYLRACYTSQGFGQDVWARFAFLDVPKVPAERAGTLVFTPTGVDGRVQTPHTYRVPPIRQAPNQIRHGVHQIGDLRLPPAGTTVRAYLPNRVRELQATSANWSQVPLFRPEVIVNDPLAAAEFVNYAQVMSRNAAAHIAKGQFAVGFALPNESAAERGIRGSAYSAEIEAAPLPGSKSADDSGSGDPVDKQPPPSTETPPSVGGVVTEGNVGPFLSPLIAALGDLAGDNIADFVDDQFEWEKKGRQAYREALAAADDCAAANGFKADCRMCVDNAGLDTYEEMKHKHEVTDAASSVGMAGGTAAAVCAVGALVSGGTVGVACVVAAVVAAALASAVSVKEWQDMEDEVERMKDVAYSPCEEKSV